MQGIGLRQRDAFPKGAFKAFPELGGGAAGKGNGKDALSGDAVLEEALDAAFGLVETLRLRQQENGAEAHTEETKHEE